ncbi:MAG: hypothetical protein RJA22_24 [Verrucomicrobiota bacterium]|jgi:hypothetical protein
MAAFAPAGLAQWQASPGTGTNVQCLLATASRSFAGGSTGVYASSDSGENFQPSNSGNDNRGPTRAFGVLSNLLFTCTSQGVFRSSDGGSNWVAKSAGLTDLLVNGIVYAHPYLVVVTPSGVFRSPSQGDGWEAAGLAGVDVRCITALGNDLFAGCLAQGIFRSTNFGGTWQAVTNGLNSTNFRAIHTKGNTLFAGGGIGSGVSRSTNYGATWTPLTNGLPSGSYRGFACHESLIFAGSFGAGVFYSSDNGDTWSAINQGLTDLTIFDLELNARYLLAGTNTKGVFRYDLANFPIQITAQAKTIGGFQVTSTSHAGRTQVLQGLDAIGGQWKDLLTATGSGAPMTWTDTNMPPPGSRLYRIKAL